jgi:hypothetical protein
MPQPLLHLVEGDAPGHGLHAEAVPQARACPRRSTK